jgi:hypothetical protein
MTSIVWANILLEMPFAAAIIGIPLWLTWKVRPERDPVR